MSVVLSLVVLFYFFGLGILVEAFHPGRLSSVDFKSPSESAKRVGWILLYGVLLNFILALALPTLHLTAMVGSGFALIGGVVWFRRRWFPHRKVVLWGALIAVGFWFQMVGDPIKEWDARSIWFLHAKMIYYSGGWDLQAGWLNPAMDFSHPDYPVLIPVMAAQLATLIGGWNEYFPKLSFFFLVLPLVFLGLRFALEPGRLWSGIFLFCFFFFSPDSWLSNGYMDGFVGLLGGVAVVHLVMALERSRTGNRSDVWIAMGVLGLLSGLKSEGIYFSVIALGVSGWYLRPVRLQLGEMVRMFPLVGFPWLGWLTWGIRKKLWGIESLYSDPMEWPSRLVRRVVDEGAIQTVLKGMALESEVWKALGILVLFVMARSLWIRRWTWKMSPAYWIAGGYAALLIGVYLVTKFDFAAQLAVSVERIMRPVTMSVLAGVFFYLRDWERPS